MSGSEQPSIYQVSGDEWVEQMVTQLVDDLITKGAEITLYPTEREALGDLTEGLAVPHHMRLLVLDSVVYWLTQFYQLEMNPMSNLFATLVRQSTAHMLRWFVAGRLIEAHGEGILARYDWEGIQEQLANFKEEVEDNTVLVVDYIQGEEIPNPFKEDN